MTARFDPLEMSDPNDFYREARRVRPMFFDEGSQYWVLTKHADVKKVMLDAKRFSAEADRESYTGLCPEAISILEPISFSRLYGLSTTENPSHDRIKHIAWPLFNDVYLSRLRPSLQLLADSYLSRLDPSGEVDLVSAVCDPFPAAAILQMLGIPHSEVSTIKEWGKSRMMLTWGDAAEQCHHARNIVRYWTFCQELVDRKFAQPEDDLPSFLGMAVRNGELTEHEVKLFCYGLMFSGHATTSAFLAQSIRILLASGKWNEIVNARSRSETITGSVDELLRLCPSAYTRRRLVLEDVEIRGQHIPKGSVLLLVIGSANRDEDVFESPDQIQLDRWTAHMHLTFGAGSHYCIGAKVVRLEYSVLLELLATRFPRMRLTSDHVDYARNLSIRAPRSLSVSLGGHQAAPVHALLE
jgi:cytochrome P450